MAQTCLEFGLQFLASVHPERGVVDDQTSCRRERNRTIDRTKTFGVRAIVVVKPTPSLAVVAVGDIELRARVAHGGIGSLERYARFDELIVPEESQRIVERLLVDPIHPDDG